MIYSEEELKSRIRIAKENIVEGNNIVNVAKQELSAYTARLQAICAHDDWDRVDGGAMGGGFDCTCLNCGKREYI